MKWYNTIGLDEASYNKEVENAKKQEQFVLAVFRNSTNKYLSPYDVYMALKERFPITSIRRAMTNLTPDYLTKTNYQKPGKYNSPNYCWTLNN